MAITVTLQAFEGTLDLLLHLIEKNKVDIYDIPIVEITRQYLDYIRQMETDDMDIMSEFLVMASTLVDIKCKMLLPREVNEEGEEEDPRAELVEKLLEYKMYKYMSFELRDRQIDAGRNLFKKSTLPREITEYREPVDCARLLEGMTLSRLHAVFRDIVKKQEDRIDPIRSRYGRIEKDEINLEEQSAYIESCIRERGRLSFRELLRKQGSRMEIIVAFLVILELMKVGRIQIRQEHIFDEIIITYAKAA